MARIGIEGAIGSGFGLIRRRPGQVMLWGLAYTCAMAVNFAILASFYSALFTRFAADPSAAAQLSPQDMSAMMPHMLAMQGWLQLTNIGLMLVMAIVNCAVYRAILHPEQGRFGYLRVGTPELFVFALTFGAGFAFVICVALAAIFVGLFAVVLAAMHAGVAAVMLVVLATIAAFVAMIWIILRFSMVGPMMVSDGKFHFIESWELTRGHAADLFIVALCLFAVFIVAEIVIVMIAIVLIVVTVMAFGGGNPAAHFSQPGAISGLLAPVMIGAAVLCVPLTGCAMAIWNAPWARAYLDLTGPEPSIPAA